MVLLPVYNETNIYSSHIFDQRWETKNCITKHVFIFANISHIHVVKCSLQGTNTTNRITDVDMISRYTMTRYKLYNYKIYILIFYQTWWSIKSAILKIYEWEILHFEQIFSLYQMLYNIHATAV